MALTSSVAILKLSTKLAVETSNPVVRVYSFTSLSLKPITNILVPSLLKATPVGTESSVATLKPLPFPLKSLKVAVETSKGVVNVYSLTSSPVLPITNILVPSLLKTTPAELASWVETSKLSTKVAAACAELTKVRLKIRNIENIFFK